MARSRAHRLQRRSRCGAARVGAEHDGWDSAGGIAADRLAKRTIIAFAVITISITSVFLGIAVLLGAVHYWMLVVSGAGQGLAFAFYSPARIAYISELVQPELLGRAVTLSQIGYSLMLAVGPALVGVLVALPGFGAGGVFLTGAVMSVLVGASTFRLPMSPPGERGRGFGAMEALRYIRATPPLGLLAVTAFVVVLAGVPYVTFLPSLAQQTGGNVVLFGVMSAVVSGGALIAGFLVSARATSAAALVRVFAVSGLVLGTGLVALGLVSGSRVLLPVLFGTLLCVGGAVLAFQASNQALAMQIGSRGYHGRLQAVFLVGFTMSNVVALPLGLLADAVGLGGMFSVAGGIVLLAMGCFVIRMWGAVRGAPL